MLYSLSDLFNHIDGIDVSAAETSFKAYLDLYCKAVDCLIPDPDPPVPPPVTVTPYVTDCYGANIGLHF